MNNFFDKQAVLEDALIRLLPLKEEHFNALYQVASDPLIWEQHPNKDRYKKDVFKTFFQGAMDSQGAFVIVEKKTGSVIGSSRYYDLEEDLSAVKIGYTFLARSFWGRDYNPALKRLMIAHAFQHVAAVVFHVGSGNTRSQKAMERLGALKTGEAEIAYYGEPVKLNFIYRISREQWTSEAKT